MKLIRKLAQDRTPTAFSDHIAGLNLMLAFDEEIITGRGSPLQQPYDIDGKRLDNRFCVLPMEGWDGTHDGKPSELTVRRWQNFGRSGAKLIWGGEAAAVCPDGRANPNQLVINQTNLREIAQLREALIAAHAERWPSDNLVIGLQLTHSGRFCRPDPDRKLKPKILYRHPLLDRKFNLEDDYPVMHDDEIKMLIENFVDAAILASKAGFDFVDLKHCHGYLGHEFLSAVTRPGLYGGSFENRTRFLREIVEGIRSEVPGLGIGVRISAYDFIPFKPDENGVGVPESREGNYPYAFGGDGSGSGIDLSEPIRLIKLLDELNIRMVCITAGSPYYCPHIQRPAMFPPSDGYKPPEDPLTGAARLINTTALLKKEFPHMLFVGTGYSYLQEWLPHVAQNAVRTGKTDFVGLGRMMLSYPEFVSDVLEGRPLMRKKICRTFSDCTTAPRNGLVSGCYPLDEYYKKRPEAAALKEAKSS